MCRRPKNLRTLKTKDKIPNEVFNLEYCYDCKQSSIWNPVPSLAVEFT